VAGSATEHDRLAGREAIRLATDLARGAHEAVWPADLFQVPLVIDRWKGDLRAFGRWIAGSPGPGVETITVRVGYYDADGDGDYDYIVDSWIGSGNDQLHEYSDDWATYFADVDDEARTQHAWLAARGR
jgi:hypothetical protein